MSREKALKLINEYLAKQEPKKVELGLSDDLAKIINKSDEIISAINKQSNDLSRLFKEVKDVSDDFDKINNKRNTEIKNGKSTLQEKREEAILKAKKEILAENLKDIDRERLYLQLYMRTFEDDLIRYQKESLNRSDDSIEEKMNKMKCVATEEAIEEWVTATDIGTSVFDEDNFVEGKCGKNITVEMNLI